MLKRLLGRLVLLAALTALAGSACGGSGGSTGNDASGEDLYKTNCATCHGTDGGGGVGKDLHGVADRLSLDEHIKIVVDGKGQMPGWKSSLSMEQIREVVAYERDTFK